MESVPRRFFRRIAADNSCGRVAPAGNSCASAFLVVLRVETARTRHYPLVGRRTAWRRRSCNMVQRRKGSPHHQRCHPERSVAESKDLRTFRNIFGKYSAQILRLRALTSAQDDKLFCFRRNPAFLQNEKWSVGACPHPTIDFQTPLQTAI